MRRRKPSASTVIALLALFVALGGTAIAAKRYLITSTSQIKPSILKQLRGSTLLGRITRVTGPEVLVWPSRVDVSIAECPPGYDVVSGGYSATVPIGAFVDQDEAIAPHTWWAGVSWPPEPIPAVVRPNPPQTPARIRAMALCAPTGQAVTVASLKAHASGR